MYPWFCNSRRLSFYWASIYTCRNLAMSHCICNLHSNRHSMVYNPRFPRILCCIDCLGTGAGPVRCPPPPLPIPTRQAPATERSGAWPNPGCCTATLPWTVRASWHTFPAHSRFYRWVKVIQLPGSLSTVSRTEPDTTRCLTERFPWPLPATEQVPSNTLYPLQAPIPTFAHPPVCW